MKKLLLTILSVFIFILVNAQTEISSKIILKNGDVLTGQIQEMKPGEYIKIKVVGDNIIQVPYDQIDQIIMDANKATPAPTINTSNNSETIKSTSTLKDFYFQTHHEFAFGLGAGKVNGYKFENLTGSIANSDVYAGYYTANGVGYKQILFAGIGFGYYSHQGVGDFDDQNFGYSLPFMLDFRYRPLPSSKFSPVAMIATGMSYYEGSLGTFTFMDAIGLDVKMNNRLDAHLLFSHTYERFSSSLSVNNSTLEQFYSGIYLNYVGVRLGVSYKIG